MSNCDHWSILVEPSHQIGAVLRIVHHVADAPMRELGGISNAATLRSIVLTNAATHASSSTSLPSQQASRGLLCLRWLSRFVYSTCSQIHTHA